MTGPPRPLTGLARAAGPAWLQPGFLIVVFLVVTFAGAGVLYAGVATRSGNELSRQLSLFSAVNAATLTGFSQSRTVGDFTPVGRATVFGLMAAGTFVSLTVGGSAVCRIARLPYSDRAIAITTTALGALATVLGAVTLRTPGANPFAGVFNGLSALGNCGLSLGTLPPSLSLGTQTVLLPLALVGGLGIPVLLDVADRIRGRRLSLSTHSAFVLKASLAAYVCGAALLFLIDLPPLHVAPAHFRRAVVRAVTLSVDARSAGFAFSFATEWTRPLQWSVLLMMLVGGASGGTAGGLKVNTVGVLLGGAMGPRADTRRPLPTAVRWLLLYGLMLGAGLLTLLVSEPQIPADRLLFLTASALGNVGLSHDAVVLSDAGCVTTSTIMLLGRVAPLLMLWTLADSNAEADIAIG